MPCGRVLSESLGDEVDDLRMGTADVAAADFERGPGRQSTNGFHIDVGKRQDLSRPSFSRRRIPTQPAPQVVRQCVDRVPRIRVLIENRGEVGSWGISVAGCDGQQRLLHNLIVAGVPGQVVGQRAGRDRSQVPDGDVRRIAQGGSAGGGGRGRIGDDLLDVRYEGVQLVAVLV